jgi:hypothetical protein
MDIVMMKIVSLHMSAAGLMELRPSNRTIARQNIRSPSKQEFVPSLFALLPIPNMRQLPALLKQIRQDTGGSLYYTLVVLHIQQGIADFACPAGQSRRQRIRCLDSLTIRKELGCTPR